MYHGLLQSGDIVSPQAGIDPVHGSSLSCRSEWRGTSSSSARRLASKMRGRCTDGGRVSRGVAHGCDLSLPPSR